MEFELNLVKIGQKHKNRWLNCVLKNFLKFCNVSFDIK